VQTASSAALALELIEKSPPHLLVSDIGMADVDGYQLIKSLRERGFKFPAIALTGYMRSGESDNARNAGFQEFIAKPVEPRALIRMAATLLELEI
jgi:CheY-like chemotaxis protein